MVGFFTGKPESFEQVPTIRPEQLQLLQQMIGGLGGPLSQGLGQLSSQLGGYAPGQSPMEQMAQQTFQQSTIPSISETFSGMGAGSSSGLNQALAAAGKDLNVEMAGMRQNQQQQALQNLMGMLSPAMGQQIFATGMRPRQPSIFEQISPLLGFIGGAATPPLIKGAFGGFKSPWNQGG